MLGPYSHGTQWPGPRACKTISVCLYWHTVSERRILVRGGHVVSMDPEIGDLTGDVLIVGRQIAAVDPAIDAQADETLDAAGKLVLPGLIDSHIHLWQTPLRNLAGECWGEEYYAAIHPLADRFSAADMEIATYAGAIELLSHGVTTVFDFCHAVNTPEHADASIAGLHQAGIRAIFGYSFRDRENTHPSLCGTDNRIDDIRRVRSRLPGSDDDLVRLAVALNDIDQVDATTNAREIGCARELGVVATVHSNLPWQITAVHQLGLLGPDIQWVHVAPCAAAELQLLAVHGGTVAVTPEVEIGQVGLYPQTGRAIRAGVPVTIGVDIPSGWNGDLLVQMRTAFQVERLREAQEARQAGREPSRTPDTPALTARKILEMVTIGAARALGLDAQTGSLTPGKDADVLVLSGGPLGLTTGDAAGHVVLQASAADVDTVIVAGRPRLRDGCLIDTDLGRVQERLRAASWRILPGVASARSLL